MKEKTRKLTTVGMLCALAYAAAAVGRVPLVLFLKYDPKDVVLVITGFLFGPLSSFLRRGPSLCWKWSPSARPAYWDCS